MECLNNYSGLFSLLAVLASVIVPFWIYHKQKKALMQDLKDKYDAMEENSGFPMGLDEREFYGRKKYLEKKLRRE